jgi:hypothetical protein
MLSGPLLRRVRAWGTLGAFVVVCASLAPLPSLAQSTRGQALAELRTSLQESVDALTQLRSLRSPLPKVATDAHRRAQQALALMDQAVAAGDWANARRAARRAGEELQVVWTWLELDRAASGATVNQQKQWLRDGLARMLSPSPKC